MYYYLQTGDKKYYAAINSVTKNRFASVEILVYPCTVMEVKRDNNSRIQYVRVECPGYKQRFTSPALLFDDKDTAADFLYYYLRLKAVTSNFEALRSAFNDQQQH